MEVPSSWASGGGVNPRFLHTIFFIFKGHAYRFCLGTGKHWKDRQGVLQSKSQPPLAPRGMDRLSGAFWAELPETYSGTDKEGI